jgi:hypothetical protein
LNFGGVTGFRGRGFHVFAPGPPTNAWQYPDRQRPSRFTSLPIHHLRSSTSTIRRHRPTGYRFCSSNIRYEQAGLEVSFWHCSRKMLGFSFSSVHPRNSLSNLLSIHHPFIRHHIFSKLKKPS